jgi:hypothetical protein
MLPWSKDPFEQRPIGFERFTASLTRICEKLWLQFGGNKPAPTVQLVNYCLKFKVLVFVIHELQEPKGAYQFQIV